jgi:hypothetical protein
VPKEEELFGKEDFDVEARASKKPPSTVPTSESTESDKDAAETSDEDDQDDDDDDDFVEVRPKKTREEIEAERELEMRYLGFADNTALSTDEQLKIDIRLRENEDNAVVIEIMRGLYKELKRSYLAKINNWIKNFTAVRNATNELRTAIEMKNRVQVYLKRYENLNIAAPCSETKVSCTDDEPGTSRSKEMLFVVDADPPVVLTEKERQRVEKMKVAPVLEQIEYMAPVTHRVETTHPMFQRKEENDEAIAQQQTDNSRLVKTTFAGKFVPVKWTCRAPMSGGKLCPRMDRVKCPLHGRVVARDETGRIVSEQDQVEFERAKRPETPAWLDRELIADINASSGAAASLIQTSESKKGERRKRKSGNLTSVAREENSSRRRLERRLTCPKNLNKIGSILDGIERRQNYAKFHHNFHYALQS